MSLRHIFALARSRTALRLFGVGLALALTVAGTASGAKQHGIVEPARGHISVPFFSPAPSVSGPLGIVPVKGTPSAKISTPALTVSTTPNKAASTATTTTAPNLAYAGGPVMTTNTVYAIYLAPTGSSWSTNYQSIVNGFFTNLAAAKNAATNVYAATTQYYSTSGTVNTPISNASTFGGAFVDTTAFVNTCSAQYAGTPLVVTTCLTDADIQAAVARDIAAKAWPVGGSSVFMVFLPRGIGSCYNTASTQCAYTAYC